MIFVIAASGTACSSQSAAGTCFGDHSLTVLHFAAGPLSVAGKINLYKPLLANVNSCIYGKRPDYLTNVVSAVNCGRPRRGLLSSSSSDFSLQRLRTKFSERAFTYTGPSAWNSLSKDLQYMLSLILNIS